MDNTKTGNLIAATRRELNLTQKALAESLHVSIQAVSKWERGLSFPDILLLEPLSQLLGLTVSELLAGERDTPPQEQLVQESLRISTTQLGARMKKWRNRFWLTIALLSTALLLLAFFYLQSHTKLFPQAKTYLVPMDQTPTAALAADVAFGGEIALYEATYADGITGETLQLELWTSGGLMRIWPLAGASGADPADWPRRETVAFYFDADPGSEATSGVFHYGAALHNGTWRGKVTDVPYLFGGFGANYLTERAEVHPEYGVVLASYYLDTTGSGSWMSTPCLGTVEAPEVGENQAILLLRLLYEYE